MNISQLIATELNVNIEQIDAAVGLLDGGDTVPFISRYRKEVTGALDDTQMRYIEERLGYLRELESRRQSILNSIKEQDKLTDELEKKIKAADSKAVLEDLYLPYKPKRRTKAQIAKEAGLEPLAMQLMAQPADSPETLAASFVDAEKNVLTVADALDGARQILMELFSENAELIGKLREYVYDHGVVKCDVAKGKEAEGSKFSDYFAYQEPLKKIPSHRALAILRGQREGFLNISLTMDADKESNCKNDIIVAFNISIPRNPTNNWLNDTVAMAWRVKIFMKLELELIMQLREKSDIEAIKVFSNNLKHLLMAAPAGSRITLGLDPGMRTGCKAVVIDGTGKLLFNATIFPHAPMNKWQESATIIEKICREFKVELISIGNGTGSRETDKLVSEVKARCPELKLTSIVVSEAGASVYSASELAAKEFPNLDVTYRGAVSIARRLQDPLAELVKIDPKAIGVGQYQHDVNQVKLARTLHAVMEDCVNAVGVDINTASSFLLTCVAGLNENIAKNIVIFRDENGPFKNRMQLKKVPRLGDKAFEQSAGFLRITNGDNPLDTSAVHPEAYGVIEKIIAHQKKTLKEIMGNTALIRNLSPQTYTSEDFGIPTVTDILKELEKPGRDPRPEFKTISFTDGIEKIEDLKAGMVMEGVISNVANFGAFVDIGVHQDGLVHISMIADKFVKDPNEVVKVGDIVKVKVLEVDIPRKRIQLTMRMNETAAVSNNKHQPLSQRQQKPKMTAAPEVKLGSIFENALKSLV